MPTRSEFYQARLTKTEEQLAAVDAAILLVVGGAQSYSLDSGQTRQMVTRASLGQLQTMKVHLENSVQDLLQKLNGDGAIVIQPGW